MTPPNCGVFLLKIINRIVKHTQNANSCIYNLDELALKLLQINLMNELIEI